LKSWKKKPKRHCRRILWFHKKKAGDRIPPEKAEGWAEDVKPRVRAEIAYVPIAGTRFHMNVVSRALKPDVKSVG